jgi:hypothetical protein
MGTDVPDLFLVSFHPFPEIHRNIGTSNPLSKEYPRTGVARSSPEMIIKPSEPVNIENVQKILASGGRFLSGRCKGAGGGIVYQFQVDRCGSLQPG